MKHQSQNSQKIKLTIFKPPTYIYKLSKNHRKNTNNNKQKLYQTYSYKNDKNLRKYHQFISLSNLSFYQWRKQTNIPIVKIEYIEILKKISQSTNNNEHNNKQNIHNLNNNTIQVNIYTQNFEKILPDMINLTLNQSIYILKQCLIGYRQLFYKLNTVTVNKFYIGLNHQGKIKIWINQNLALNCINYGQSNIGQMSQTEYMILQDQMQILNNQVSIVNKIIKMIFLLASSNCKYFFYGLQKQLAIKKYTFTNCINYINKFINNTANLQIPNNLKYMINRKTNNYNTFCSPLEKSNLRTTNSRYINNNQNRQRKLTQISSSNHTNSIKQFNSYLHLNIRDSYNNTQFSTNKSLIKGQVTKEKKIQSQKSQRCSIRSSSSFLGKDKKNKIFSNNCLVNIYEIPKQNKISLHIIDQNYQKFMKQIDTFKDQSQIQFKKHKSIRNFNKQRPSITVLPSFLNNLQKGQKKQQYKNKSHCDPNQRNLKSYSVKSQKSNNVSFINTKIQLKPEQKFGKIESKQSQKFLKNNLNQVSINNNINKNNFKPFQTFLNPKYQQENINQNRARSLSTNVKQSPLSSLNLMNKFPMIYSQHQNQPGPLNLYQRISIKDKNTKININKSNKKSITENSQNERNNKSLKKSLNKNQLITVNKSIDKVSSNRSTTYDGYTRKKSFLIKTNQSQGDQNQKSRVLSSRMDFSSISIQNKLNINSRKLQKAQNHNNNSKNINNNNQKFNFFDNDLKLQLKRSLITSKYGFGQILQNPSCKQIQQENQSRSYDGSSLKNTQNLNDFKQKPSITLNQNFHHQVLQALELNKIGISNKRRDLIDDSIDQTQIKQKNQQLLMKNQWKKTINNLQIDNMILNQSIVQHNDSFAQIRQPLAYIKLQKLDKLTKNMYFSIVNKSQQNFLPMLVMDKKRSSYNE